MDCCWLHCSNYNPISSFLICPYTIQHSLVRKYTGILILLRIVVNWISLLPQCCHKLLINGRLQSIRMRGQTPCRLLNILRAFCFSLSLGRWLTGSKITVSGAKPPFSSPPAINFRPWEVYVMSETSPTNLPFLFSSSEWCDNWTREAAAAHIEASQ